MLFWLRSHGKTVLPSGPLTGGPDVLLVKLIYKQQYVCEVYTSKINCKEVKILIK